MKSVLKSLKLLCTATLCCIGIAALWSAYDYRVRHTMVTGFLAMRNPPPFTTSMQLAANNFTLAGKHFLHHILGSKQVPVSGDILSYNVAGLTYPDLRHLFEEIFITQSYTFQTTSAEPFIIDCGSNIGMSILFFKKLYPNAHIIGFEPDQKTFDTLTHNITHNNITSVQLYNKALYNKETELTFYHNPTIDGDLRMGIHQEHRFAGYKVKAVPLSSFIDKKVDFLKMDIEGAERYVFEDLVANDKLKLINQMVFEYHHHVAAQEDQDTLSGILAQLENNGFGYQVTSPHKSLTPKNTKQTILIYAYQKS